MNMDGQDGKGLGRSSEKGNLRFESSEVKDGGESAAWILSQK